MTRLGRSPDMTFDHEATRIHRHDLDREIDIIRAERELAAATSPAAEDGIVDRARRRTGKTLIAVCPAGARPGSRRECPDRCRPSGRRSGVATTPDVLTSPTGPSPAMRREALPEKAYDPP